MRPIVDKITAKNDLRFPYRKVAASYRDKPGRDFLGVIALEEHSTEAREILEAAAERIPVHVSDKLQRAIWLKTRIAQIRLAFLDRFLDQPDTEWLDDDPTLAIVTDAVADVGYCLRNDQGLGRRGKGPDKEKQFDDKLLIQGLLKNIGADDSLPRHIEHIGLLAADGHPEVLGQSLGLVEFVRSQQQVRSDYWGERLAVTMEEYGEVLPREERQMDREIINMLSELYGQPDPIEPVV